MNVVSVANAAMVTHFQPKKTAPPTPGSPRYGGVSRSAKANARYLLLAPVLLLVLVMVAILTISVAAWFGQMIQSK